jgi:hypothetical protein
LCYVNDLCTTPCSGTLGHHIKIPNKRLRCSLDKLVVYLVLFQINGS